MSLRPPLSAYVVLGPLRPYVSRCDALYALLGFGRRVDTSSRTFIPTSGSPRTGGGSLRTDSDAGRGSEADLLSSVTRVKALSLCGSAGPGARARCAYRKGDDPLAGSVAGAYDPPGATLEPETSVDPEPL